MLVRKKVMAGMSEQPASGSEFGGSRPLRVAYIIGGLGFGGKERQLAEILQKAASYGIEPYLFTFREGGGFYEDSLPFVRAVCVIRRRVRKSLYPPWFIWKKLRYYRIDLVHTFDLMSSMYGIMPAKMLHIPFIDGSVRDAGIDRGLHYILKYLTLKFADTVISNSRAGLSYYKVRDGAVVPNAIDIARFGKSPQNTGCIVMNANFYHVKDQLTYLRAARVLIGEDTIRRAYLIGDGPRRRQYMELVDSWGLARRIIFLGHIKNVEEVLQQCDVGVLSSTKKYSEGISNAILEYMSSNLVAVASDVGGTPEIIRHKTNGLLFEAENHESCAEMIKSVFLDAELKKRLLRGASETIRERFSSSRALSELREVYAGLIVCGKEKC